MTPPRGTRAPDARADGDPAGSGVGAAAPLPGLADGPLARTDAAAPAATPRTASDTTSDTAPVTRPGRDGNTAPRRTSAGRAGSPDRRPVPDPHFDPTDPADPATPANALEAADSVNSPNTAATPNTAAVAATTSDTATADRTGPADSTAGPRPGPAPEPTSKPSAPPSPPSPCDHPPRDRRPRLLGRRSPSPAPRRRPNVASLLRRLLSLAVALGLWQYLTVNDITWWVRFDRLPTVTEVASEFGDQLGGSTYYEDLEASLTRILSGFVLAAFAGIAAGILVTRSRIAGDFLQPLLEVVRPIPAIAMVPIAILVFPTDEQGITFITFLAAFFPILVSTRHAVRALPTLWEDALRTMGGRRRHTLWHVVLPGTLPGVFGGLSVGMGVSWICVISAEMISGQYGVGYRTWQAYTIVDYPGVIVGMISIGILGWATAGLVELAGRRATRWLPREGGTR